MINPENPAPMVMTRILRHEYAYRGLSSNGSSSCLSFLVGAVGCSPLAFAMGISGNSAVGTGGSFTDPLECNVERGVSVKAVILVKVKEMPLVDAVN